MTQWKYPDVQSKRAPRSFRCSNPDCQTTIEQGSIYQSMNHGRYCVSCAKLYQTKYNRIGGV